MPKTLERLIETIPTVAPAVGINIIATLFEQSHDLQRLVVATDSGCRPLGLIERECCLTLAAADGNVCARRAMRGGVPIFDAATDIEQAIAVAHDAGQRPFESGIIVTKYDTLAGIAPPARLAAWYADRLDRVRGERNAARRALSQATEQRLLFLAHMGHELRTPLNAIIGYADVMRSRLHGPVEPAPYRTGVNAIYDAGHHLLNIINSILDLAKIDAKSMPLYERRFDIRDAIEDAIAMVRTAADSADIRLAMRVRPELPKVLADEQIVRQILVNLLSNAVKFSPSGSRVTVAGDIDRRGALRLVVKDQGPGIKPQDIETVMQPFRQAESNATRRPAGTGLGLALVKAFAELHDGSFQLLSSEGKGTRAVVTLPAARVSGARPSGQCEFVFTRPSLRA